MSASAPDPGRLTDLLDHEQSFRKQIMSALIRLLTRPDTDPVLKMLIILGGLAIVGISFTLSVCLIHLAHASVFGISSFDPFRYARLIAFELSALGGLSIPLVVKASSHEQALRLEDSLDKIRYARARN